MVLKYPNSNIDFLVTPAYFLGDFDIFDREETLGERLEVIDPNNKEQLRMAMEEHFFKGGRVKGLTGDHKAELLRVLSSALDSENFDFDALVTHEREADDNFTLPYSWDIHNSRKFFENIYELAMEFWAE